MPKIKYSPEALRRFSDEMSGISSVVSEIEGSYSNIARAVDHDIRELRGIDGDLRTIERNLESDLASLKRMSAFLEEAAGKYQATAEGLAANVQQSSKSASVKRVAESIIQKIGDPSLILPNVLPGAIPGIADMVRKAANEIIDDASDIIDDNDAAQKIKDRIQQMIANGENAEDNGEADGESENDVHRGEDLGDEKRSTYKKLLDKDFDLKKKKTKTDADSKDDKGGSADKDTENKKTDKSEEDDEWLDTGAEIHLGHSDSVKKHDAVWNKDGSLDGKVGGIGGSVETLSYDASAGYEAEIFKIDENGEVTFIDFGVNAGGSVSLFETSGYGYLGSEENNLMATGEITIGEVGAGGSADFQIFSNGKFDPALHGGVKVEAIGGEISGDIGWNYEGDSVVKVGGSLNYGAGAHFDAGLKDGVLSLDAGVSLGVGGSVKLEVDIGNTVNVVVDGATAVYDGAKVVYGEAKEFAGEMYDSAKEFAGDVYDSAKDFAGDVYDSAKDFAGDAVDSFKDGASAVWNFVTGK